MNAQRYETVSTCTRKPACQQIISYCIVLALLISYYAVIIPNLNSGTAQIVFGCLFGISSISLFISSLRTSQIDPVDPVLVTFLNGNRSQLSKIISELLYCQACKSYVRSTSRHCKICRRCVQKFDHHCLWINNCIGQANYSQFMCMMVSVVSFCLIFIITFSVLWNQQNWSVYLTGMIVLWVCFSICLLFFTLLTILLAFHIFLICKGTTTFEFVSGKGTQKRQKKDVKKNNVTEEQIIHYETKLEEVENKQEKNTRRVLKTQQTGQFTTGKKNNKVAPLEQNEQIDTMNVFPERTTKQNKGMYKSWSLKVLGGHACQIEWQMSSASQQGLSDKISRRQHIQFQSINDIHVNKK